jgi:Matrixin
MDRRLGGRLLARTDRVPWGTRLVPGVVVVLALVSIEISSIWAARADNPQPALALCCAWGKALGDGTLTYSLAVPDGPSLDVIRGVIHQWDDALSAVSLVEVAAGQPADISVRFDPRDGGTQGETVTAFNRRGVISRVQVTVDGPLAPGNSGGIEQVTKHEIGHALGLGHANFQSDLMYPMVYPVSGSMSGCDLNGVIEANRWRLVDGRKSPRPPAASQISC